MVVIPVVIIYTNVGNFNNIFRNLAMCLILCPTCTDFPAVDAYDTVHRRDITSLITSLFAQALSHIGRFCITASTGGRG
jgi:hypothetical protein